MVFHSLLIFNIFWACRVYNLESLDLFPVTPPIPSSPTGSLCDVSAFRLTGSPNMDLFPFSACWRSRCAVSFKLGLDFVFATVSFPARSSSVGDGAMFCIDDAVLLFGLFGLVWFGRSFSVGDVSEVSALSDTGSPRAVGLDLTISESVLRAMVTGIYIYVELDSLAGSLDGSDGCVDVCTFWYGSGSNSTMMLRGLASKQRE